MKSVLHLIKALFLLLAIVLAHACQSPFARHSTFPVHHVDMSDTVGLEVATLAGGCFWKMDAIYQQLEGVKKLAVGYSGGELENPTYEQVCKETTGHAEAVQIHFDPSVVSYAQILDIFWHVHNPTEYDREGNDVGSSYRSAIFYHNKKQAKIAERVLDSLDNIHYWSKPIVTEITAFKKFYRAEDYHQNYYNLHPNETYTYNTVRHKVEFFENFYRNYLKKRPI